MQVMALRPIECHREHVRRPMKRYMVIESFRPGCKAKIYDRFHAKGRMLPPGLTYLDSWLEKEGNRCFQLMETSDPSLFAVWLANWSDLVSMEIIELGEKPGEGEAADSQPLLQTPPAA